jgi:hypothetical protein
MSLFGYARDLVTPLDGSPPIVVAEDRVWVRASAKREILDVRSEPPRDGITGLVGAKAGGHLREALDRSLPGERNAGTPLYLLLDDLSGASLVANWAWSRWIDNWTAIRDVKMEGVCIGFRPGSRALKSDGTAVTQQNSARVPPLQHPDDAQGWHALPEQHGVGMRRARRIDLWLQDGLLHCDSGFQDSANSPDGGRIAVHEYRLTVTANPHSGEILTLAADPRVLPYDECPMAVGTSGCMIGTRMSEMRQQVLEKLRATSGCTHLNDALRALAEGPQLLAALLEHDKAASRI